MGGSARGEVASYLKRSRLSPGASSFGHGEPSTDVPEADASAKVNRANSTVGRAAAAREPSSPERPDGLGIYQ